MALKDVLITDYVHPVLLQGLHNQGLTTTYAPEMSRVEMEKILHLYNGVVINTRCAIDHKTINAALSLKWIARLGSGLDIIDCIAAKEKGVVVISSPEGNSTAVAEHAMGMLLCLANNLISADQSVRNGAWLREQHRGWEIEGKTIGIIGHGNNGSAFGRLWKGWNVKVIAYDKYLHQYGTENVIEVDQKTLLQNADIISLHIPLTDETRYMVNADFISKCKPGCILINTSRGKMVRLEDALHSLKNGQLGGMCLDVFPTEPPSNGTEEEIKIFKEFSSLKNVVLSPHIAGWTMESKRKIAEVLLTKIAALKNQ